MYHQLHGYIVCENNGGEWLHHDDVTTIAKGVPHYVLWLCFWLDYNVLSIHDNSDLTG